MLRVGGGPSGLVGVPGGPDTDPPPRPTARAGEAALSVPGSGSRWWARDFGQRTLANGFFRFGGVAVVSDARAVIADSMTDAVVVPAVAVTGSVADVAAGADAETRYVPWSKSVVLKNRSRRERRQCCRSPAPAMSPNIRSSCHAGRLFTRTGHGGR
jgi:hypothetical protein